ncbi:N-lysine methyltransferase KMT5A-A-like [Trematomus bernacchii]|uniref:N-lysine methyltransferase KMT5A-A-like n=1 Tax=Trematomus bernacchii TaxID=40690 RepID=UPI00146CCF37|nr:N-lysine methyltransferase KMT5A-A-like [Trematomus bernacchii]
MNPLLDMASARPRRAKIKPREEAAHFTSLCKDKDGFDVKFINSFKGRGVFSCRPFQNGDFLIEYRGEVITKSEREHRQQVYHCALKVFMFDFRINGQELCVDAAKEDNSLGRLVNDDHVNPNCKMKLNKVDGKPHLCLFALKDISPGEEIAYDYSDSDWPWRCKISTEAETLHEEAAMASESHYDDIQQVS